MNQKELISKIRESLKLSDEWVFSAIAETRDKYSIAFKRVVNGVLYEEDRLVVVTDKQGNILSRSNNKTPVSPIDKAINNEEIVYRKIKKDMYYLYSGEPITKDIYPTIKIDNIIYLLDEKGNIIGQKIPPPFEGLTWSGCHQCSDVWAYKRKNAYMHFTKWCSNVYELAVPHKDDIINIIENPEVKLYFADAHGASSVCSPITGEYLYASDVRDAMSDRDKMYFCFLGHCHAMVDTGPNTFSYEFSKGDPEGCAIVGYYMLEQYEDAWSYAYEWQDYFFRGIDKRIPIYEAYENSLIAYPELAPATRFYGDQDFMFFFIGIEITDIAANKQTYLKNENILLTITCKNLAGSPGTGTFTITRNGSELMKKHITFLENDPEIKSITVTLTEPSVGTYTYCAEAI